MWQPGNIFRHATQKDLVIIVLACAHREVLFLDAVSVDTELVGPLKTVQWWHEHMAKVSR